MYCLVVCKLKAWVLIHQVSERSGDDYRPLTGKTVQVPNLKFVTISRWVKLHTVLLRLIHDLGRARQPDSGCHAEWTDDINITESKFTLCVFGIDSAIRRFCATAASKLLERFRATPTKRSRIVAALRRFDRYPYATLALYGRVSVGGDVCISGRVYLRAVS